MKILLISSDLNFPPMTFPRTMTWRDDVVAKAQLKKVVEYIDTLKFYDDFGGQSGEFVAKMIKKALLEEVEDGR